jgi:hypothetical protein
VLAFLVLLGASSAAQADCVDPATFARSTVSIARDVDEGTTEPHVVGIRGTGWFLSSRLIVTAAHVAEAMQLSAGDWKDLEIRDTEASRSLSVRLSRIAGSDAEKIAVLALKTAYPDALALHSRMDPLVPDERVLSLAYPGGRLRFAGGRFVRYAGDGSLGGTALLEVHDGNDRLVLDHGASGAPVLDCDGRVVAVVSTIITQTISFVTGTIRTSTPWQTPNVVSMPIQALQDFSAPN